MPASSQPRIIIFTGASCPWCNRVKDYLMNSLRQAVMKLGAKVEIRVAELNQEERLAFLAMEQERWKG